MDFRAYLKSRRASQSTTGQFVQQARDDPHMAGIESWPQLQAYLLRRASGREAVTAIKAAEPVWKGYRAFMLKSRRQN